MSTPGGYGGYGQDPNQQYDPLTGEPVQPGGQTSAYPGPESGGYQGLGQYPQTSQFPQTGQYPQTSAFPNNFPTAGFNQPQPPPPGKRTGLIVGVIAAVLVVAVGATLLIVLLNKKDEQQAGPNNPPPTTTTRPVTTTTTTTTTTTRPTDEPVYPGWQTVSVPSEHVLYDVPPDWKVESGTDAVLNIPNSTAAIKGISTYKLGACPESAQSFRAKVGVAPESSESPQVTAKKVAQTWADALAAAYKGKTATPSTSQQRTNHGKTSATLAVVRVTTEKTSCNPPRMLVAVVSFQTVTGTESLVMFGDQDVPDAISNEDAAKVLTTARPAST